MTIYDLPGIVPQALLCGWASARPRLRDLSLIISLHSVSLQPSPVRGCFQNFVGFCSTTVAIIVGACFVEEIVTTIDYFVTLM